MTHSDDAEKAFLRSRVLRLERDLLRARKFQALGMLASGLAHDFNNALSAISGYAELMRRRFGKLDPDIVRYNDIVLASCTRASEMVESLKLFTRKDRRCEQLMDAHELLAELQGLMAFTMPSRFRISWDLGAANYWLNGDPNLFQGSILHLLILAREALPRGGAITIRTSNLSARIRGLSGCAVFALDLVSSEESLDWNIMARLMEHAPSPESSSPAEMAGLVVVREYVDSQNGQLLLERIGSATMRLRLMFPLALLKDREKTVEEENLSFLHQLQEGEAAKRSLEKEPSPPALLIVDDEAGVRDLLRALALSMNVPCICRDSGRGLQEELKAGLRLRSALVDQHLENENGLDLCGILQTSQPGLVIGLMTGYSGEMDSRVLQSHGFSLFEKPFDLQRIKEWILSCEK